MTRGRTHDFETTHVAVHSADIAAPCVGVLRVYPGDVLFYLRGEDGVYKKPPSDAQTVKVPPSQLFAASETGGRTEPDFIRVNVALEKEITADEGHDIEAERAAEHEYLENDENNGDDDADKEPGSDEEGESDNV